MNKHCSKYNFNNLDIYRYEFSLINSNMYLICNGNSALVIDPHISDELYLLLDEKNIKDITIVLTHEHPDHTCGIPYLVNSFKAFLICQENCANIIKNEKNNRPTLISFVLAEQDKVKSTNMLSKVTEYFQPYMCKANLTFKDNFKYNWQNHILKFVHTPGHSKGSSCVLLDDDFVFTGDSLLENLPIILRFKGGCESEYKEITLPYLHSLPSNINVFPGHGEMFQLNKNILNGLKFN